MKIDSKMHPRVFSFCGYSGSGKTTLIEKLILKLSQQYNIGYIKHDSHQFTIDHDGKDTDRMSKVGAKIVYINDPSHYALIASGFDFSIEKQLFLDCDILFIEGHKHSNVPKFLFVEDQSDLVSAVKNGEIKNVIATISEVEQIKGIVHFSRNNLEAILNFINNKIEASLNPPLYGLVLSGGKSQRMGDDKNLINYHGVPQVQYCYDLLSKSCQKVFVSCREDQKNNLQSVNQFPFVFDRFINFGPLGGILSAMVNYPEASWLVIACDLPLVSEKNLNELIKSRDSLKQGTVYYNEADKQFEPLFAIYENTAYARLLALLGQGYTCPQKFFYNSSVKKLLIESQTFLRNVNTKEESHLVKSSLKDLYA